MTAALLKLLEGLMGSKRGAAAALACAALLLVVAGQGAWLVWRGMQIEALQAQIDGHAEQLQARDNRLGTLRGQVTQLTESQKAGNLAFDLLKAQYDRLAEEAGVRRQQDAEAIARARAEADDASRTLDAFMARYRASYAGDCKAAIEQLDRACPNLVTP